MARGTVLNLSVLRLICHASILVLGVAPQNAVGQDPTNNKPEAKDVAARVTGFVIWTKGNSELLALALPAMKESVIRRIAAKDGEIYPTFHAISGPDSSGRLAYIEEHFFGAIEKDRKHLLKTIRVDGTVDAEVFSRPGSAMWAATRAGRGEIGAHLALAPSGGKAAFLSGLSEKQMPRALLSEGNIEIWDIDKKLKHEVTTKAINQPMSWFPDGKRLAYVKLVPRVELPKEALGLDEFGEYFGESWDKLPAIYILDVETNKSSFLHVGWTPVVASDGKSILVGGWDRHSKFSWYCVRNEGRESAPVRWPGGAGDVISLPAHNIVLHKCLPNTNVNHYAIQIALIDSEKFQTLVAEFNPHALASFGHVISP
jgi:hypothetical protein